MHTSFEKLDEYKTKAKQIREQINRQPLNSFYRLEKSTGGGYICPICGSGTGSHKTGALYIRKEDNRVTCFSNHCFGGDERGEDTLGALRTLYPEKTEAEIFTLCGFDLNQQQPGAAEPPHQQNQQPAEQKEQLKPNFTAEILAYHEALKADKEKSAEARQYLLNRGFSEDTINRFKLGYDEVNNAITIPYNQKGNYFTRRSLEEPAPGKGKYDKLKKAIAGTEPLFNAGAVKSNGIVFVTEGALDAISIMQAGGDAIALNGTGYRKLIEKLTKTQMQPTFALCLDNDQPGREATKGLAEELEKIGYQCFDCSSAIMGDSDAAGEAIRKDANEVLQKDGAEALTEAVKDVIDQIRASQAEQIEEEAERTGATLIDSFLSAIQTRIYEPLPTGFKELDNAIGGGLMRQQIITLGAAPGAGKTALSQWIFEGIAERGKASVLYLNLEMSREQILARSFSRMLAKRGYRINAATVLRGYEWTEPQRKLILETAEEYKKTIANRMVYNPDGITPDLDNILMHIEAAAKKAKSAGMDAPLIVIDYMQIIRGKPGEDAARLIARIMASLKGFAIRHNTTVFVITAHNRFSNQSGIVTMESGRDTSSIEYGADTQLGLTFTQCLKREGQEPPKKPDELKTTEKAFITLKVLKSRFSGTNKEIDLHFDGETMTFEPIKSYQQPKQQQSKKQY